ncbi:SDR family oxidoreductase [Spirosoma taeanense]|uniref:SDR family oxidoreductase n=1 Tax=Spirosoma taeanense TaxID=2735870 RepID=A0A6M5Y507_9BACT|nr:SDR family oxidoreductase [Spirosoma taeanense]QJW88291.1 SDR family oxidoreductase [Spirosoma taeanense]
MEARNAHTKVEPLEGKRILITGGTTGIGQAIAILLGSYKARIFTLGRHQEQLDEALSRIREVGGQADGIVADLSKQEDVERVFRQADRVLGGIDMFISNAALAGESIADMDNAGWRNVVETNLLGYMACTKEAVSRMQAQKKGHIVFIGSMSADVRESGSSVYVATKAAIQGFAEALRKEVNETGIKVCLIEPGKVKSDIHGTTADEQKAEIAKEEMLLAEDIAVAVHYVVTQPHRCDVVSMQIRPHMQLI